MNRFFRQARVAIVAAIIVTAGALAQPAQASVDFGFVYSNLSPHGSWLVSAQYGRVWRPGVYSPGWNPYYDGHWVYTDVGWTWVSDYDWGAIPYHYGTWVSDPGFGWVWVPGYTWAPSWVVFRTGPDYIGWAPVSPGFSVGVSVGFGSPAPASFTFVPCRDFLAPRIRSQIVPYSRTNVVINNTRIVNNISVQNNIVVNRGPDVSVIERASGRKVRAMPIERVSRVGTGSRFSRDQIRIDSKHSGRQIRAAEPVSARSPLPGGRHGYGRAPERGGSRPAHHGAGPARQKQEQRSSELRSAPRTYETRNASIRKDSTSGSRAPGRRLSSPPAPRTEVVRRPDARPTQQAPHHQRTARVRGRKTQDRSRVHPR